MTVLVADALTKRFGGLVANDHLSLQIAAGETHAVIGPNGAGKTTLLAQLAGAIRPDSGTITLDGRDITRISAHQRVAMGIARSFQVTNVFQRLSALDNVALAVQARDDSSFRFWHPVARETQLFDRAHELLQRVNLAVRAGVAAGSLAHGEQRQLEIALALASAPRLLLLDEPMAGMGPDESAQMVELLHGLKKHLTLVLVEHDMDTVFRLADRISVLVYGRVLATGKPEAIRANSEVQRAYLGTEAA